MEKDLDPWLRLPHSPWQFGGSNCGGNLRPTDIGQQNTNSVGFPSYINPYGCAFSGNAAMPISGFQVQKPIQKASALIPPANTTYRPTDFGALQKGFVVFDRSGFQTSLIFSSVGTPLLNLNSANPGAELQGSSETYVSDGHGGEEMHEDTEEIDALLYSDSDEGHEEDEGSTGHSPVEVAAASAEEVASSALPAKRRRVDVELDASLVDTASSARPYHRSGGGGDYRSDTEDDAESSCVGGEQGGTGAAKRETPYGHNAGNKRLKRERIQETVGVLRRIIPGGQGKDAAAVLDEAIRYLKTLKLKAKVLGASPL